MGIVVGGMGIVVWGMGIVVWGMGIVVWGMGIVVGGGLIWFVVGFCAIKVEGIFCGWLLHSFVAES